MKNILEARKEMLKQQQEAIASGTTETRNNVSEITKAEPVQENQNTEAETDYPEKEKEEQKAEDTTSNNNVSETNNDDLVSEIREIESKTLSDTVLADVETSATIILNCTDDFSSADLEKLKKLKVEKDNKEFSLINPFKRRTAKNKNQYAFLKQPLVEILTSLRELSKLPPILCGKKEVEDRLNVIADTFKISCENTIVYSSFYKLSEEDDNEQETKNLNSVLDSLSVKNTDVLGKELPYLPTTLISEDNELVTEATPHEPEYYVKAYNSLYSVQVFATEIEKRDASAISRYKINFMVMVNVPLLYMLNKTGEDAVSMINVFSKIVSQYNDISKKKTNTTDRNLELFFGIQFSAKSLMSSLMYMETYKLLKEDEMYVELSEFDKNMAETFIKIYGTPLDDLIILMDTSLGGEGTQQSLMLTRLD